MISMLSRVWTGATLSHPDLVELALRPVRYRCSRDSTPGAKHKLHSTLQIRGFFLEIVFEVSRYQLGK